MLSPCLVFVVLVLSVLYTDVWKILVLRLFYYDEKRELLLNVYGIGGVLSANHSNSFFVTCVWMSPFVIALAFSRKSFWRPAGTRRLHV